VTTSYRERSNTRMGVYDFARESTETLARAGQAVPRTVTPIAQSDWEALTPASQRDWDAFGSLGGAATSSVWTGIKMYDELLWFDKANEERIAILGENSVPDASTVLYLREHATESEAFVRNAWLNAESFTAFQTGIKGTIFDDEDRSIGLFPQEPTQATITIQAFVQGQQPLVVTNEFLLTSVSEASQEKYQVFQTFDDDLIYFFGRNPHVYTYGGSLVNAGDLGQESPPGSGTGREPVFQWKNRFQSLYENILRGTKCVDNGARAILTYENVLREGFLLNFSMSEDARNPLHIPFSFTFYVTREKNNHRAQKDQLPVDFIGTDTLDPRGFGGA